MEKANQELDEKVNTGWAWCKMIDNEIIEIDGQYTVKDLEIIIGIMKKCN